MLIRFGLHLDRQQPQPPATALGVVTLGPLGLLDVLETQLGLPGAAATSADQLMAYRACLAEANHPSRFYHASFAVDPINVSRTLLVWRATLYEHGWSGRFDADAPPRLRDLADVERLAAGRVTPGRGQRAQRATAALGQLSTQIDSVELLDEVDELPAAWRALLERLGFVAPLPIRPQAVEGCDLRVVQDALAATTDDATMPRTTKIALRGDGSFVVLRGASRDITAQAVAECVVSAGSDGALVIAQRDGIVLDNAFERTGLPRAGFQHYSRFRAVTQVLKLALSLIWRPVDPQLLLQFLIHPVGPLRRRVRDALADAVSQQPGIGGRKWRDALHDIETSMREHGDDAAAIAASQAAIDSWLGGERFDPARGAPVAALTQRAQLCSNYLAMRMNDADDDTQRSLYGGALAQAEALLRALRALADLGDASVGRIELDRLIDEVSSAAPDANVFAEARHVCATTDPATVVQPWRRVYWWDLASPAPEPGYPWSRHEIGWLRGHGVALFDVADVLRNRTRQWLRPILNARQHVTLVVHDSDAGYHPLWTRIDDLFTGFVEVRVDDALLNGAALPDIGITPRPLQVAPLPAPRRWWRLPAAAPIPPRDVESYSSLSKLFDWPHGYVLRYAARLRPGRAQDLADGNRLYGNLAHGLLERFFDGNPLWAMLDARGVRDWFAREMPALLEAEGAVLLEAGRGVDKQRVVTTLERALIALVGHLHDAGIEAVRSEFHDEVAFKGVRLGGDIDLLLTDRLGREIVLDVKWSGEPYRAKDLAANRQLQLATYAYLRRTRRAWPQQAYFVVESGHVLAQDAGVFPNAVVHPAANRESVEVLWQRVDATYDWRRRQLDAGLIEVNVDGTEPTAESARPAHALDGSNDPDRYDDFVNLVGWETYS